jgi:hypothetical protein
MIKPRIALAAALMTIVLAGCSSHGRSAAEPTMNRTDDRTEVLRILHAAASPLDADRWEVESSWLSCTDVAAGSVRYSVAAGRRGALPASPKATMQLIADALTDAGFPVTIQHESTEDLWAVGYPNGFLGGSADDGSGFDVTARDGFLTIDIDGHCVPGDVPDRNDPLNETPIPVPPAA